MSKFISKLMVELDHFALKTAAVLNEEIEVHVSNGGKLTPLEGEFWAKLNAKIERRTYRSRNRASNE